MAAVTPLSPDQIKSWYNQWKGAQDFRRNNPRLFARSTMGRTAGDALVRNVGQGGAVNYQAIGGAFGGAGSADAQGYARYMNDIAQTQPITEFAGYLERQGVGRSQAILDDLAAGNMAKYESYIPQFGAWRAAETKRSNAQGFSGFNSFIRAVGPAVVTARASLPASVATGAAFGGATGGIRGAVAGGLAGAIAPQIKLPGVKAAVSNPIAAARSVVSQLTPMNVARLVASRGVAAAAPSSAPARVVTPTINPGLGIAAFARQLAAARGGR